MVCFYCQVITLYTLRLPDCYIVSLPQKHLSLHQTQKIVRLCPSIEYTLKIQKWWTIPKITLFLPIKWWLIPNIHTKTYIKWWQHTKHRIQYHHQICPSHKDTYCPYHTNKSPKMSVLHVHTTNLSTFQNIVNTTLLHSYPHYNIKLSTSQHLIIHTITHSFQYHILTHSKIHPFSAFPW